MQTGYSKHRSETVRSSLFQKFMTGHRMLLFWRILWLCQSKIRYRETEEKTGHSFQQNRNNAGQFRHLPLPSQGSETILDTLLLFNKIIHSIDELDFTVQRQCDPVWLITLEKIHLRAPHNAASMNRFNAVIQTNSQCKKKERKKFEEGIFPKFQYQNRLIAINLTKPWLPNSKALTINLQHRI